MRAVILTKSEMKAHNASGHCTVAFDVDNKKLIRLVSNKEGGPISGAFSRQYECFDIVDCSILERCPTGVQQENAVVYMKSIKPIERFEGDFEVIYEYYRKWIGDEPLYMDILDHSLESVDDYHHSIEILIVSNLETGLDKWGNTKASFDIQRDGIVYNFRNYSVKDPEYILRDNNVTNKKIGNAYIIVSIPYMPYENDGKYHKIIAAIYPIP